MKIPPLSAAEAQAAPYSAATSPSQLLAPNISPYERLLSVIGGAALALYGLRRAPAGLPMALLGGALIGRGLSGRCAAYAALRLTTHTGGRHSRQVTRTLTINRGAADIYAFWHKPQQIAQSLPLIERLETWDAQTSRWGADLPLGIRLEWDVELLEDQADRRIVWQSLHGSPLMHSGVLAFAPAPGQRGTEVALTICYQPPGGLLGLAVAKLLSAALGQQMMTALRRCKQILETGQRTTSESVRNERDHPERQPAQHDTVAIAGDQSFPASDPPAWASGPELHE